MLARNRDYQTYAGSVRCSEASLEILERARILVPHIIASGVFSDSGETTTAIQWIVDDSGQSQEHAAKKATILKLVESVVSPGADQDAITKAIDEEPLNLALEWAAAGYVLGIAVGQQLGPNAFTTGGAR